jgi:hypothetical protein
LCGAIQISDYYNFGYGESASEFYSFAFIPLDAKAQPAGNDIAHVYFARKIGRSLADKVTQRQEQGFSAIVVRIKCTVYAYRVGRDKQGVLDMIEILDWQGMTQDRKGWKPWVLERVPEGVPLAFALLRRAGQPAVPALVGMLCNEQTYQTETVDTALREQAAAILLDMELDARKAAYSQLERISLNSASKTARSWALRYRDKMLNKWESQYFKSSKRQSKPVDQAARAATLLRNAQTLEYDNPDGALTLYRMIVADFPETPQAKTASARVKAVEGK